MGTGVRAPGLGNGSWLVGAEGTVPMGHQVQGTPSPPNPGGLQENAGHLPDGVSEARAMLHLRPCTSMSPHHHHALCTSALSELEELGRGCAGLAWMSVWTPLLLWARD